ncbi:MAG: hypothetical protein H6810_02555 [Phycisphaeraceae bacterium]|nr:MAG: hypothetical protein H6810_02555 [Phycisphaeraceae bacterium]
MAERARVHSIDAPARFRPTLVKFIEECKTALISAEADAGRTISKIRSDRYPYWKKQIRVRQDELNRAKTELIMKQAMREPDEARSTVEERKAVEKAKRRVSEAEEKTRTCKHWLRQLEREQTKFQSSISVLRRALDTDMPRALAELDRIATALEEYVKLGGKRPAGRPRASESDGGRAPAKEGES